MYFKIEQGCDLFNRFQDIRHRCELARKAVREYVESEYPGCNRYLSPREYFEGGLCGVCLALRPKGWVTVSKKHGIYAPRVKSSIWADWKALPVVKDNEIKDLIAFDKYSKKNDDGSTCYYLMPAVVIREDVVLIECDPFVVGQYKPVEGMQEITATEFHRLQANF